MLLLLEAQGGNVDAPTVAISSDRQLRAWNESRGAGHGLLAGCAHDESQVDEEANTQCGHAPPPATGWRTGRRGPIAEPPPKKGGVD